MNATPTTQLHARARPINRVRRFSGALLAAAAALLIGCANANVSLNRATIPVERRVHNHTRAGLHLPPRASPSQQDGYFVGLALSGGGSRSANFSAACMFELQRLGILQRVDYISSVSGGSLTAALYCLDDDREWNPRDVQRRLTHSFATDVATTVFMPWNALLMVLTPWDRSDVLADSFRRVLYTKRGGAQQTFADLRADRPGLIVNATDLQSGKPFAFNNENFDQLNSDLARYPISYAVAASAAVPVLMHQVTLRDYSTTFKQYKHLIDGGITDNLGVTSLVETYYTQVDDAREHGLPDPYPRGLILIVIDSHTNFDEELGDKPDVGVFASLSAGAGLSSTALLNRVSSATLSELIVTYSPDETQAKELRAQIGRLAKDGILETRERDGKSARVFHISLDRVGEMTNLPFASFGQRVNSIATYFNIDPTEAYHLYKAAELLVRGKFEQSLEGVARDLGALPAPSTAPSLMQTQGLQGPATRGTRKQ